VIYVTPPEGGNVNALVSCKGLMFANTNYGMYNSDDNGNTWSKLASVDSLYSLGYNSNLYGSKYFASNDSLLYIINSYGKLYVSENLGNSWEIRGISFHCQMEILAKDSIVVVGEACAGGISISTDYGHTWTESASGKNVYNIYINDNKIYSSLNTDTLFVTNNFGQSWNVIPTLSFFDSSSKIFYINQKLCVFDYGSIYYTINNGVNWASINKPCPTCFIYNYYTDADTIYIKGDYSIYYVTKDFGTTWTVLNFNTSVDMKDVSFNEICRNGNILAFSTSHGILVSEDGGLNWEFKNTNLNAVSITNIENRNDTLFLCTNNGLFLSIDNGQSYSATGMNKTTTKIKFDDNLWYVIGSYYIYCSNNQGLTWQTVSESGSDINDIAVDGAKIVLGGGSYGTYNDLYISLDSGATYSYISDGLPNAGYTSASRGISSILLKNDTIFVGTKIDGIWYSIDNGTSWIEFNNGLPSQPDMYDSTLIIYPNVNQIFYWNDSLAIASYYIYKRAYNDTAWHYSPTDSYISYVNKTNNLTLGSYNWSGNKGGVYYYMSDKHLWVQVNNGFPVNQGISKTASDNSYAYALYSGLNKIWVRPISEFSPKQVSGTIYNDDNNNYTLDFNETGLPYVKVGIVNAQCTAVYDTLGNYTVYCDNGDYTLQVQSPLPYATVFPTSYLISQSDSNKNFGIHFENNVNDLRVVLTPFSRVRPGFDAKNRLTYKNFGSTTVSGNILLDYSDSLDYISASSNYTYFSNDTLQWQFSSLHPFEERNVDILYNLPSNIAIGDTLVSKVNINPIVSDTTPTNNKYILTQYVTGAFDPNNKEVDQGDSLSLAQYNANKELIYTIHFQNVGNDTAFNIRILDTLSYYCDLTTFTVLSSSHNYTYNLNNSRVLEFLFNDIALVPKSTDEVESNGFIKYAVKVKNMYIGSVIKNTANIYFDFNTAVVTNTTQTGIYDVSLFISKNIITSNIEIYPNPSNGNISIKVNGNPNNSRVDLFSCTGKLLFSKEIGYSDQINIANLNSGIYIVKISGDGVNKTGKVVIY